MYDVVTRQASDCLDGLRNSMSAAEYGYKIQALAAHVLLRLGYSVEAINRSGHPDIVVARDGRRLYFEVEAEVSGPRRRQLTTEDFLALSDLSDGIGYFALAISFPVPRWIVVTAERLEDRNPSSNVMLEALSDVDFSSAWTHAFLGLLNEKSRRIRRASFRELCEQALSGNGL